MEGHQKTNACTKHGARDVTIGLTDDESICFQTVCGVAFLVRTLMREQAQDGLGFLKLEAQHDLSIFSGN